MCVTKKLSRRGFFLAVSRITARKQLHDVTKFLHMFIVKNVTGLNKLFTRVYRKKKLHSVTIFWYTCLPQRKKLHELTIFVHTFIAKKLHGFTATNKIHSFTENKQCMHVANLPTFGPLLILSPCFEALGNPPHGRGYFATPPTCGPFLLLFPALKRWGPPIRHELCSHRAHLWATSDVAPRSKALGTPHMAGVT